MKSTIAAMAHAMYVEEVARARRMPLDQKLLEGPRLFERACRLMLSGIRHQHPELDERGAQALLSARLARLASLEGR